MSNSNIIDLVKMNSYISQLSAAKEYLENLNINSLWNILHNASSYLIIYWVMCLEQNKPLTYKIITHNYLINLSIKLRN